MPAPLAAIFGCAGVGPTAAERAFFRDADPLGFILFARNVDTPERTRALVAELRGCVGRADAPVLIDQEGGRVARLKPPHWRAAPPGARFGELYADDPPAAVEACWINGRLLAADVASVGADVDCVPVLDVPVPGSHGVIGDRAYSTDPSIVAELARAAAEGLMAGGVTPVAKHLPGHGRARADSHVELPVVEATLDELAAHDFPPFAHNADLPWGMTAHVLYSALGDNQPATTSRRIVSDIIRGRLGFDGFLLSDDLSMQALGGTMRERAEASLFAGCDAALHCNGKMEEMQAVAAGCRRLDAAALVRLGRGRDTVQAAEDRADAAKLADYRRTLDLLLGLRGS